MYRKAYETLNTGWGWWLMPVIQGQPQANSSQDPILKISNITQGWQSGSSGRTPA
jgi:hypothetical protein